MYKKKVYPLEPQARRVVEADKVEAEVDVDPEAAADVAAITPLH